MCGLPLVFPVMKWDRVKPGVKDVFLSWSGLGNQKNLSCQVETIPGSITEVNSYPSINTGHFNGRVFNRSISALAGLLQCEQSLRSQAGALTTQHAVLYKGALCCQRQTLGRVDTKDTVHNV